MEVDTIERLGSHILVDLRRGEWCLTAWREGACSFKERETVAVKLDASRLHWFDPRDGRALSPAGSAE
jgi:hypothetical protein